MHFFAALSSLLALTINSAQGRLAIPEGWWLHEVIPVGVNQFPRAYYNTYNPLLNATLKCRVKKSFLWEDYELWGSNWLGVPEKKFKKAAGAGNSVMTKWKFREWRDKECLEDGTECEENVPFWHAKFRLGHDMSNQVVFLWKFHELSGCFGTKGETASWSLRNGTHEMQKSMKWQYPPLWHPFDNICKKA